MNKAREKLLLIQIQSFQDHAAFTELYQAFIDPLYRYIYFKVNDKELAQDLTAEVFMKSWKDFTERSSKEIRHVRAYLYQVARNRVIDHYRSAQHNKEVALEEAMNLKDELVAPHNAIDQSAEVQQIMALMKRLKDSYQEILLLKHIEELSLTEIANILEKSAVATRVLLHRANQALKREYEKESSKHV